MCGQHSTTKQPLRPVRELRVGYLLSLRAPPLALCRERRGDRGASRPWRSVETEGKQSHPITDTLQVKVVDCHGGLRPPRNDRFMVARLALALPRVSRKGTRSPSRQDAPLGLYAPSGAPRGQAAKGGPRTVPVSFRESPVRRPSGMLREGETAGTVQRKHQSLSDRTGCECRPSAKTRPCEAAHRKDTGAAATMCRLRGASFSLASLIPQVRPCHP